MKLHSLVSVLVSAVFAGVTLFATAVNAQMEPLICLPMIANTTQAAHDDGSMSYKLPVFSTELDAQLMAYLEAVLKLRGRQGEADKEAALIPEKATKIYSEIN